MYICDDCGHTFYRPKHTDAQVNCPMEDAREGYNQCPDCNSGSFGNAEYCPRCEKWVPYLEDGSVCCEECTAEIMAAFRRHLDKFIDGKPSHVAKVINEEMDGWPIYDYTEWD